MREPIGELLVRQGVMTPEQCEQVLRKQRQSSRPFGRIAEEMFGIDGAAVERAWAEQYSKTTRWIDPRREPVDPAVRDLINRRQAWQFRLMPIAYDGGELMVCTTLDGLVRAMNFASRQIPVMCYFVLTQPEALADALGRVYPMDGMSRETLGPPYRMAG
jgi:hypothetical protein